MSRPLTVPVIIRLVFLLILVVHLGFDIQEPVLFGLSSALGKGQPKWGEVAISALCLLSSSSRLGGELALDSLVWSDSTHHPPEHRHHPHPHPRHPHHRPPPLPPPRHPPHRRHHPLLLASPLLPHHPSRPYPHLSSARKSRQHAQAKSSPSASGSRGCMSVDLHLRMCPNRSYAFPPRDAFVALGSWRDVFVGSSVHRRH